MFIHYLKHALRSLWNNKVFSTLNIIGFAVGFAICIIIALFAYREYSVNSFFPDSHNVYRLVDVENKTNIVDHEVASALQGKYPEIKTIAPLFYFKLGDSRINIKSGNNSFLLNEMIGTTNSFFKLSGLKAIVSKSEEPFVDKNSIVLSKSTALSMFGKENALGENIEFLGQKFEVSAVVEDIPSNSTIGSDVYFNDENKELGMGQNCNNDDCYLIREIYFSVNKGTNMETLISKMNADFPANRTNTKVVACQPVRSIYYSTPLESSMDKTGNKKMLFVFITIAALTLFMSVFNYINYTISKQLSTLKNTGIKMTNGAGIGQMRRYYFVEVGVSVILSFALAVLIVAVALPFAEQLLNVKLSLEWMLQPHILTVFGILLLTVILLSTLFPVSMISRAKVTTLLGKGSKKFSANTISKVMSVAQLVISVVLLSGLLLVNKQLSFVKTADVGFNKELLLRLDLPYPFKQAKPLYEACSELTFIKDLAYTSHAPGASWSRSELETESGTRIKVRTMNIGDNFIKTFGLKIIEGREPLASEQGKAVLLTETTYKELGWKDFHGKQAFGLDVVGIVNDIQVNSFHTLISPVALMFNNMFYNSLNIRLLPGSTSEQISQLKSVWKKIGIDEPFTFQFYDEYYNSLYQKEDREAKAMTVFSVIAFMITCLGLLGQIMQTTEQRTKEIGIRKINGATISEIMKLLNKNVLIWIGIAIVIATPIAYYAMNRWLQSFAYKTALSWWIFALAGIIALAIALLTVSWQSWRAASRNPVEALRYE